MKHWLGLVGFLVVSGCGGNSYESFKALSQDEYLRCAALTMLYLEGTSSGEFERDVTVKTDTAVGLMTFVQAYGLGKGIREKEAFSDIEAAKQKLQSDLAPSQIREEAIACLNLVDWDDWKRSNRR